MVSSDATVSLSVPHIVGEKGVYHNCQAKAAANMDKPMLAPLWAAGISVLLHLQFSLMFRPLI